MDAVSLLALGNIKGIAEAGAKFAPADHGLAERDVAELLACGAAEVVPVEAETAPEAVTAKTAARKATK